MRKQSDFRCTVPVTALVAGHKLDGRVIAFTSLSVMVLGNPMSCYSFYHNNFSSPSFINLSHISHHYSNRKSSTR